MKAVSVLIGYINMNNWYFFLLNFRLKRSEMPIFIFFLLISSLNSIKDVNIVTSVFFCVFTCYIFHSFLSYEFFSFSLC